MFKHTLGSKAKSRTNGLTGILMSRSENLYGCNRYYVQPAVNADSKVPDGWWMDEGDIVILEAPEQEKVESDNGGPMSRTS